MSSMRFAVVAPHGRLDASRAPALEQELKQQLTQGNRDVVVDLSDTTYISSNGLRVLLAGLRACQADGGTLRLCCLNARLMDIFEMVGFDQIFEIFEDRETAESAFQP